MSHALHLLLSLCADVVVAETVGLLIYVAFYLAIVLVLRRTTKRYIAPSGEVVRVRFGSSIPTHLGHDGFTCFGVIFIAAASAPGDLIAHEYRHTCQERALLYVVYPIAYLLLEQMGYRNNPLETDAYEFGTANSGKFPPSLSPADLR